MHGTHSTAISRGSNLLENIFFMKFCYKNFFFYISMSKSMEKKEE